MRGAPKGGEERRGNGKMGRKKKTGVEEDQERRKGEMQKTQKNKRRQPL